MKQFDFWAPFFWHIHFKYLHFKVHAIDFYIKIKSAMKIFKTFMVSSLKYIQDMKRIATTISKINFPLAEIIKRAITILWSRSHVPVLVQAKWRYTQLRDIMWPCLPQFAYLNPVGAMQGFNVRCPLSSWCINAALAITTHKDCIHSQWVPNWLAWCTNAL